MNDKELLDVINEHDEVIDKQPRDIVHQQGLLHREIHVWLYDQDNNIYFQKRGTGKSSGGLLDASIGGHVDSGETYKQAAVRETLEETGLAISEHDLVLVKKFHATFHDTIKNQVNNFSRHIFVVPQPFKHSQITKEADVAGVDFETFSISEIRTLTEEERKRFDTFILTDIVPDIIQYIEKAL